MDDRITRQMIWLVACGGLVIGMSMGVRNVQGLYMLPILSDRGWGRETFSFALGLQMLVWGLMQPLTGWLCDRHGSGKVIAAGCAVYAAGLLLESRAATPAALAAGSGLLIGVGLTATTFGAVYGGLARSVAPQRQGWAQGVAGAIGGLIQFLLVPLAQSSIDRAGWSVSLQWMAVFALVCAVTGLKLEPRLEGHAMGGRRVAPPPAGPAVRAALSHSGFWLLNLGFVSCGFQLAFLGVHLPAYLRDAGFDGQASVNAIAIIALANAFGTYVCGRLGDLYRRKYLLSGLYAIRTLAITGFVLLPISTVTLYTFALVMGLTWLGTVPLTNGVVAQIFGVRHLGSLFGLVFLGHQLGGFLGAWLGGRWYESTHSYAGMWALSIALGVASVMLHLPIRDRAIESRPGPLLQP